METKLLIPRILQVHAEGRAELLVRGGTVRALLDELQRAHPALHRCIRNETGQIRQHINLFINNDFLRDREGLDTELRAGDVVSVFQAVSGG